MTDNASEHSAGMQGCAALHKYDRVKEQDHGYKAKDTGD
jgi:hypothetical protein